MPRMGRGSAMCSPKVGESMILCPGKNLDRETKYPRMDRSAEP